MFIVSVRPKIIKYNFWVTKVLTTPWLRDARIIDIKIEIFKHQLSFQNVSIQMLFILFCFLVSYGENGTCLRGQKSFFTERMLNFTLWNLVKKREDWYLENIFAFELHLLGQKKTLKCEKNNSTLFLKSPRNTWPKNSS